MTDIYDLIRAMLAARTGPDVHLVEVRQQDGAQGFSGASVRYFDVQYRHGSVPAQATLVVKDAPLAERRVLAWLGARGGAVPRSHSLDLATDAPSAVCMQYVGDAQPPAERVPQVARALAAIHAAGMGHVQDLSWLPRADAGFAAEWIVHACWRDPWQHVLAGDEYVDAFGNHWGPPKAGGDFAAQLGAYTQPLEGAAARFVEAVARLWDEGDSLTLIHADFHGDHARLFEDHEYIIDWGFAHYGPLYIDLPNYFTRDDALLYRDALAELGHEIPADVFLTNYDAVRPYPGFKYFGIGLWNWCYGDPPHRREYVTHFIDMIMNQ